MVFTVNSFTVLGVDGTTVKVEVDSGRGLPGISIVGLPDSAVKESRERVKAAIVNSGFPFPSRKIVVNLAPADLKKEGTLFDLPIAIGILGSVGMISQEKVKDFLIAGELGLNGEIGKVKGILSATILAKEKGYRGIIIPEGNVEEATLIEGVDVIPVKDLSQVIAFLNGDEEIEPAKRRELDSGKYSFEVDMADIVGQYQARRALEIAAAGHHNLFMVGPPGSGKTMLARRLPTIMPPMSEEEIIETTKVYSVAGLFSEVPVVKRPFRSPHSGTSEVALIGGGTNLRPGEVSLAHNGVLFLDEMAEFKRSALESLRQPLEDGFVVISRASGTVRFPSRFSLVAASNPCPCGFKGFEDENHYCKCTPSQVKKYFGKISGPILDRIDIHIPVPAVKPEDLKNKEGGEPSEKVRERVLKAHEIQKKRFKNLKVNFNSQMGRKEILKFCKMEDEAEVLLNAATKALGLSARSFNRVLKLSRTIADLDSSDLILRRHVAEALSYRPSEELMG
jgi:magnesium chelatase family protein